MLNKTDDVILERRLTSVEREVNKLKLMVEHIVDYLNDGCEEEDNATTEGEVQEDDIEEHKPVDG